MKVYRFLKGVVNKVKETKTYVKYQEFKDEMKNQKMSREKIGEDRLGNVYYQYYSPYGLPTRREVEFIDKTSYALDDQAFWLWLNKRDELGPTKEEVQRYYFEEALRIQRGIEWDQKEEQLALQFYEQRKRIQQQNYDQKLQLNAGLETQEEIEKEQQIIQEQLEQEQFDQDPLTSIQEKQEDKQYTPGAWSPKKKGRKKKN